MANRGNRPASRRGAPAASLLTTRDAPSPAPRVVDRAVSAQDGPEPEVPIATATKAEHEKAQRELREHMAFLARMGSETPAQLAEREAAAESPEQAAEVAALPTPEERAERAHQEAIAVYLKALIEMPADEPRYVVGLRPPRPRFGELVLEIGDVVPGAALWPRLDSWTRAGIVVPEALATRKVS